MIQQHISIIINYCSFPAAEKNQNAAAAPDAVKASARAWALRTAPAEAEKKVNEDLVLGPELINGSLKIGECIKELAEVKT